MPKLSVETFLAALTVASLSVACSKAAPASAVAPEPATTTVQPAATAAAAPVASAAPALAASEPSADMAPPVDAGIETAKKPGAPAPHRAKANAACGAGTCSDDMKK